MSRSQAEEAAEAAAAEAEFARSEGATPSHQTHGSRSGVTQLRGRAFAGAEAEQEQAVEVDEHETREAGDSADEVCSGCAALKLLPPQPESVPRQSCWRVCLLLRVSVGQQAEMAALAKQPDDERVHAAATGTASVFFPPLALCARCLPRRFIA